jgi:hypothetical protein
MAVSVSDHQGVLEEYWAKGLIGTATCEQKLLATELSTKTGLTLTQIKVPSLNFSYLTLAISFFVSTLYIYLFYLVNCIVLVCKVTSGRS